MAAMQGMTVRVLLAVGNGRPAEVATFPVPLRAVVHKAPPGMAGLGIEVDFEAMHEGLRHALRELADELPPAPTGFAFDPVAETLRNAGVREDDLPRAIALVDDLASAARWTTEATAAVIAKVSAAGRLTSDDVDRLAERDVILDVAPVEVQRGAIDYDRFVEHLGDALPARKVRS